MTKNEYIPPIAIEPGEILKDNLEAMGMSQKELAIRMGRPEKTISEIINGKARITSQTAIELEKVLKISASFWNNLEKSFQETKARLEYEEKLQEELSYVKLFPLKYLNKLDYISSTKDIKKIHLELTTLFEVASLTKISNLFNNDVAISYRRSNNESNIYLLNTWIRLAEIEASKLNITTSLDKDKLREILPKIKELISKVDFIKELQELCTSVGLAVIFIPEVPGIKVCGLTKKFDKDKQLIALSFRYKTEDQFWYTFLHEIGHIFYDGKNEIHIDIVHGEENSKEKRADEFARNFLINEKEYRAFINKGIFTRSHIFDFAKAQMVTPGIVIGRLQHDKHLPFATVFNKEKIKYEWTI